MKETTEFESFESTERFPAEVLVAVRLDESSAERLAMVASGQSELNHAMETLVQGGSADTTKDCATGTCD